MYLLYPIGLLALAGLIIPVLIHLWSRKQGEMLKIGSISLLGENAITSSKSLKLTDLLLLVLRCLILLLIAVMLSQPYLEKNRAATKKRGWVLIDKTQLAKVYQTHQNTIDSLLTMGFELHDFNLGFAQLSLKDSASRTEISTALKYTALLNQLNKEIPSGYSAYLFADRRLNNFDGDLPRLNFELHWKEVELDDTIKIWSSTFLNKIYHAKSTPNVTTYSADQLQNIPAIKVMIYDPKGIDSKYIKAGLYAIADFTKRKIDIIKSSNEADVIFWLSDQAIKLEKRKPHARLFSYQHGKVEKINSILQLPGEENDGITLKKRIVSDRLRGTVIWTDGYGAPILIKETKVNHFHFYSHLNPQWNDLVWDEQFVKALVPIVLGNQSVEDFGFEDRDADQRVFARTQFPESKHSTSGFSIKQATQNIDYLIWILAFVVLLIERIVSFRHKNIKHAKS